MEDKCTYLDRGKCFISRFKSLEAAHQRLVLSRCGSDIPPLRPNLETEKEVIFPVSK